MLSLITCNTLTTYEELGLSSSYSNIRLLQNSDPFLQAILKAAQTAILPENIFSSLLAYTYAIVK
jgi:hypothetical protein